jgi:hypothetical protein
MVMGPLPAVTITREQNTLFVWFGSSSTSSLHYIVWFESDKHNQQSQRKYITFFGPQA